MTPTDCSAPRHDQPLVDAREPRPAAAVAAPTRSTRRRRLAMPVILGACLVGTLAVSAADAVVAPGTPGQDVTIGADNDDAGNRFIQPAGVSAKQHMEDTDILFGRGGADLLIGRKGSDTLLAGPGVDVLVGGPEAGRGPNSDVLLGEDGDDVAVWAPGDGSEAFLGDQGYDTMILAPLVLDRSGNPALKRTLGRRVPQVTTGGQRRFSCAVVAVPGGQRLGVDHLVRFSVDGRLAVTVRQRGVERVVCPSGRAGYARVALMDRRTPRFAEVPVRSIGGLAGAIINPAVRS